MIYFLVILIFLFLLSLITFNKSNSFDKDKMPVIRIIMAIVIILGHISTKVDMSWIQALKYWGAPFVSVFFFISGYGLSSSKPMSFKNFI